MNAIMGEEITETGDYVVDEKDKVVNLTEEGVEKVEKFFGIENFSDPENLEIQHCVILALRAKELMHRDKDYVVKDDEVLMSMSSRDASCRADVSPTACTRPSSRRST